ncbi:MAG: hypothetical protein OHK0013_28970 [Sandaracinaceae bacterium]
MVRSRWYGIGLLGLGLSALGCAGTPTVGEPCSGSPQLGGCTEGAVCVLDEDSPVRGDDNDPVWDTYTCRATCTSQRDCPSGTLCEPVPTTPTISACMPSSTP